MELLIGLVCRLGFVPIFHFPVPRDRFPLPVPRVSNMIVDVFTIPHRYIYLLFFYRIKYSLD